MFDSRVSNLANILVNYSIKVQPNEWVAIMGNVVAMPLIEEVARYIIKAGGNFTTVLMADSLQGMKLREASEAQLKWVSPLETMLIEQIDAFISLSATDNTRALSNVDPKKQQLEQLARTELMKTFAKREMAGEIRWVGTQYPCQAYAQEADMDLFDYEAFVYKATYADHPEPVKHWEGVHKNQARVIDWLKGKKEVVVRGPNVDMTLSIEDRTFINGDGTANMPCGEIFTSPVENSANGWIKFNYPAIRGGRDVEGVELTFKEGKVVDAKAKKNEAFLLSQLDSDDGSRYLGEFAVGTNYAIDRFTKSILYDEKIGGTIHLAIGRGFMEAGGVNESVVHWDFICGMQEDSEILVDGELFYKDGQIKI